MGNDRDTAWRDFLMSLAIVGLSLYPLYRDDLERLVLRVKGWLAPPAPPEPPHQWVRDLYDDLR